MLNIQDINICNYDFCYHQAPQMNKYCSVLVIFSHSGYSHCFNYQTKQRNALQYYMMFKWSYDWDRANTWE